jgi:hypothetical protein
VDEDHAQRVTGSAEILVQIEGAPRLAFRRVEAALLVRPAAEVQVQQGHQVGGVGVAGVEVGGAKRMLQRLAGVVLPEPEIAREVVFGLGQLLLVCRGGAGMAGGAASEQGRGGGEHPAQPIAEAGHPPVGPPWRRADEARNR